MAGILDDRRRQLERARAESIAYTRAALGLEPPCNPDPSCSPWSEPAASSGTPSAPPSTPSSPGRSTRGRPPRGSSSAGPDVGAAGASNPSDGRQGGCSNTPLPATTQREPSEEPTPAIRCLPVVCDTVYVTFEAPVSEWVRVVCAAADAKPRRAHYLGDVVADGHPLTSDLARSAPPPAGVCWRVIRGSLDGFATYQWRAEGVGPWSGVRLLMGELADRPEATANGLRSCLLMVGSAVLWAARGRGEGVADVVRRILRGLTIAAPGEGLLVDAPPDDQVKPNRVDLCCDHWGYDWTPADMHRFARRRGRAGDQASGDRDPEAVETEERFQYGATQPTIYIGSRRAECRQLCLYDKTAEGAKSGKLPWLEPIWREFGWEAGTRVWRAEVKFGGGWLRAHGMKTLADMDGAERELWTHYVGSVRHVPGRRARIRYEAPSPVWLALSTAVTSLREGTWRWQPRKPTTARDARQLGMMTVGCASRLSELLYEGPGVLLPNDGDNESPPWRSPTEIAPRANRKALMRFLLKLWRERDAELLRRVNWKRDREGLAPLPKIPTRLTRLEKQPTEAEDLFAETT